MVFEFAQRPKRKTLLFGLLQRRNRNKFLNGPLIKADVTNPMGRRSEDENPEAVPQSGIETKTKNFS